MIGIYKIISPSNRIYIGQSTDLNKRFKQYLKLRNCKGQTKLYNSFLKYGANNHIFEIIEECTIELLNERERYWQEHYNCNSQKGLNCLLINTFEKRRIFSEETKNKQKLAKLGSKHTEETKKLMSSQRKGCLNPNYNKQFSKEHKEKLSLAKLGTKRTNEVKEKIKNYSESDSFHWLGKKHKDFTKEKMSKAKLGKKGKNANSVKPIIDLSTNIEYCSIQEASEILNINYNKLYYHVRKGIKFRYK